MYLEIRVRLLGSDSLSLSHSLQPRTHLVACFLFFESRLLTYQYFFFSLWKRMKLLLMFFFHKISRILENRGLD